MSVHQTSERILGNRSIVAFRPLGCTVVHRGCFLQISQSVQMKYTVVLLLTVLRVKQRRALWAFVGDSAVFSVFPSGHFLFPGWSLTWSYCISYFWPTEWWTSTLMSWKPNKRNKCDPAQIMIWQTHENEWLMLNTNQPLIPSHCFCLTFAAQ